jgi:two-component system, sensor histidine kinase LadS
VGVSDPKTQATAAIEKAQEALDEALSDLAKLPALDTKAIGLSAHALANFLTVSGAVVDLLTRALQNYPEPQVKVWLEALGHSTNLMMNTVSRLMNNTTGGEARLRIDDVSMPTLVQRACAYYQQSAEYKGIRLTFSAADDVPPIRTDRVVVSAVLDNLLSNAVKYSPKGKRIWVRVRGERGGVVCSVQDEGPGLSREDHGRLFQPGVRLGPVPSAGEPSVGYGLALAKKFTETLGGEISCASTKGEGSTFTFWLPARLDQASDRRPASAAS